MSFGEIMKWAAEPLLTLGDISVSVYNVFFALVVVSIIYWLTRLVRIVFERIESEMDEGNHHALYVIRRFIHYAIIFVGIVVTLSALGIDMSKLAMIATALSVGVGMGMQTIFNNFFSGFIILFEKSLKVGDYIELQQGLGGTVVEIRVRSTLIRTSDNLDVVVPNAEFVSGRVTNWTHNDPTRRLRIPFSVAYGTDITMLKKVVMAAASAIPTTLTNPDKKSDVWLEKFGDNSLEFILAVWVDPRLNTRPGALVANYLEALEATFRQHHIQVPFPQREIHVRSGSL